MIDAVLLVTDFSAAADAAASRAVQLAQRHDAVLLLAHLTGSGPPDVAERLPRLAAQLARRHRLPVRGLGSLDDAGLRAALAARPGGLLVLAMPPPAPRWAFWRRPLASRLLAALPGPLLLVGCPAGPAYTRLLVALGASPLPARSLLQAAAGFAPDAELELFHALDIREETRLQAALATARRLRDYRELLDGEGRQHLRRLGDVLAVRRNRLRYTLGRGDAVQQILVQQDYGRADLIVIGQTPVPRWWAWLGGGTAARLLTGLRCDLLVWPQPAVGGCDNAADGDPHPRTPR